MRGKPVVLMDLDSVVVDLQTKWYAMYNKVWDDDLKPEDVTHWNIERFVKPECGTRIYSILDEPGFFLDLPAIPGAIGGLWNISKSADIVILTSALGKPEPVRDKLLWVQRNLRMVKRQNTIVTARKDLIHGDIMVDDSPNNLKRTLARHKVVLDYPYNRNVKDAERAYDWDDIVRIVNGYIND